MAHQAMRAAHFKRGALRHFTFAQSWVPGIPHPGLHRRGHMPTRHGLQTRSGLVMGLCYISLLLPAVSLAADGNTIELGAPRQPARADDSFTRLFPELPPFAPA